jgi:hypothetical protein
MRRGGHQNYEISQTRVPMEHGRVSGPFDLWISGEWYISNWSLEINLERAHSMDVNERCQ